MHVNPVFGCCPEKDPKYFAMECKDCPLNAYLFARDYFSAVNCSCKNTNKKAYCAYCRRLQDHLNYQARKVCVKIDNIKNLSLDVVDFDKYL